MTYLKEQLRLPCNNNRGLLNNQLFNNLIKTNISKGGLLSGAAMTGNENICLLSFCPGNLPSKNEVLTTSLDKSILCSENRKILWS